MTNPHIIFTRQVLKFFMCISGQNIQSFGCTCVMKKEIY